MLLDILLQSVNDGTIFTKTDIFLWHDDPAQKTSPEKCKKTIYGFFLSIVSTLFSTRTMG